MALGRLQPVFRLRPRAAERSSRGLLIARKVCRAICGEVASAPSRRIRNCVGSTQVSARADSGGNGGWCPGVSDEALARSLATWWHIGCGAGYRKCSG